MLIVLFVGTLITATALAFAVATPPALGAVPHQHAALAGRPAQVWAATQLP